MEELQNLLEQANLEKEKLLTLLEEKSNYISDLQKEKLTLMKESSELKADLESTKTHSELTDRFLKLEVRSTKEYLETWGRLLKEMEGFRMTNDKLVFQEKTLQSRIEQLENRNTRLSESNFQAGIQSNRLENNLEDLKRRIEEFKIQISRQKGENYVTQGTLNRVEVELSSKKTEVDELQLKLTIAETTLEHLEGLNECLICNNKYDFNSAMRIPKTMPCGHTLCDSCLVQWREGGGAFRCPFCNTEHGPDVHICVAYALGRGQLMEL